MVALLFGAIGFAVGYLLAVYQLADNAGRREVKLEESMQDLELLLAHEERKRADLEHLLMAACRQTAGESTSQAILPGSLEN